MLSRTQALSFLSAILSMLILLFMLIPHGYRIIAIAPVIPVLIHRSLLSRQDKVKGEKKGLSSLLASYHCGN